VAELQVVKTIKIPVHYALTKRKLSILNKLTAKTTHGVWLWSNLFEKYCLKGSYADRDRFYEWVKSENKLPAARFNVASTRPTGCGRVTASSLQIGSGR